VGGFGAILDTRFGARVRIDREHRDIEMDPRITRLETEIGTLRADLARAKVEVRTLRHDIQGTKAELSCLSWQTRLRSESSDFRTIVLILIGINLALFAAF
jgi:hypothetical protein